MADANPLLFTTDESRSISGKAKNKTKVYHPEFCWKDKHNNECAWNRVLPYLLSIAYVVSGFLVMGAVQAANYSRRYIQSPDRYLVLNDLSFEWLPDLSNLSLFHEASVYIPAGIAFFFVVLLHKRLFTLQIRIFLIWGTLFYLRCITIIVTSYPDPSAGCKGADPLSVYINPYVASFFHMASCGDLVFSGHTVMAVMTLEMTLEAFPFRGYYLILHFFALLCTILGVLSILMTRLHYFLDVIVAIVFTVLFWERYREMLGNPRYNFIQRYKIFEKRSDYDIRDRCRERCCTFWEAGRYSQCGICPWGSAEDYCEELLPHLDADNNNSTDSESVQLIRS